MASPLKSGKQSVNLAASAPPGSRIRRDPPPAVKELVIRDPHERDTRMVVIGVIVFALALFVILIGFASAYGWTPSQYIIRIDD
jgi:hypothetical protein